jgi:NADH-quinone oxidoreductase subunit E
MLSPEERATIDHELAIVPQRRAACIEALKAVQHHRGWVDDDALQDVADYLGMSTAELDGVATFYNLVFRRPVGRHVIRICDSVSCWILGHEALLAALARDPGVRPGETSADGRFTLLPMPCLGVCEAAPALMVDDDLHTELRPERLGAILEGYE